MTNLSKPVLKVLVMLVLVLIPLIGKLGRQGNKSTRKNIILTNRQLKGEISKIMKDKKERKETF